MIVLELLGYFIVEVLGGLIMGALVEAVLWPLRKLRELLFLTIAAIDRYFAT